jgi:2-polyprenyl-3-methyl-5-hydroxy-6-metoxy-1,4-benzoquinol methylase
MHLTFPSSKLPFGTKASAEERASRARNGETPQACPLCGGMSQPLFLKRGFWIRACETCHHRFVEINPTQDHVQQVYGDPYFELGGAGYPGYLKFGGVVRAHGRRYGQLVGRYVLPGRVLDVGAAGGFILQGFVDNGWSGKGIEPNKRMADHARQLGLDVETTRLEEFSSSERYDLVALIQIVSHFVDPREALRVASEVTSPNGFWLFEAPNPESRTARLTGKYWYSYNPPSVLHWFTPERLGLLVAEFGFREVARGRPEKWIVGAHLKSLLRHNLDGVRWGSVASRMFGILPDGARFRYPAEDAFWILFRRTKKLVHEAGGAPSSWPSLAEIEASAGSNG